MPFTEILDFKLKAKQQPPKISTWNLDSKTGDAVEHHFTADEPQFCLPEAEAVRHAQHGLDRSIHSGSLYKSRNLVSRYSHREYSPGTGARFLGRILQLFEREFFFIASFALFSPYCICLSPHKLSCSVMAATVSYMYVNLLFILQWSKRILTNCP